MSWEKWPSAADLLRSPFLAQKKTLEGQEEAQWSIRGLAALRAGGVDRGVGDGILRRRAPRRSCGGRRVGGLRSRCCGEDRDRCYRAAPEAVAAPLTHSGQGGSQDLAEARRLFGLAAAQGDAEAQGAIGQMHHLGDGGPKDLAKARRLYGLAAAQGHADAQAGLGGMHYDGEGGPNNLAEPWRLLGLAAEQGHDGAQYKNTHIKVSRTRYEVCLPVAVKSPVYTRTL